MKLHILGSGSKGNCYLLQADNGSTLMIECGVPHSDIIQAIDHKVCNVVGCLVSHEHGDHAKSIVQLINRVIDCYTSQGTLQALELSICNSSYLHTLQAMQSYRIAEFIVMPFGVQHDAQEPLGFLIEHPECGRVLFATDTYYLKYRFKAINNVLIECNYIEAVLDENIKDNKLPLIVRNRLIKSHMSLENCKNTLLANDLSQVNNIILIHLSDTNSDARAMRQEIEEATGKNVLVAEKNLKINFNKTPF